MDLFARPITGVPGAYVNVLIQSGHETSVTTRSLKQTGEVRRCLNLGSYNYLGFAEKQGPVADAVENSIRILGNSTCSSRLEMGNTTVHRELEKLMSEFLGKEDCITFGMGYATNSTTIPCICSRGDLIISDMLNHASIIVGCRSSGASIKVFKHNDPAHLEQVVRKAIIEGQPRTHRPWNKILIVVEGIYSMEGEILKLPEIVEIKNRYKCYLYVDEAHSIGALGPTGRGVCEYWGVDTKEVDILMGTFTKSFASAGGYMCADKTVINHLRMNAFSSAADVAMPVPLAQQIISSLSVIMGKDGSSNGKKRLDDLHRNTVYFRTRLTELGFIIIGSPDSPVIPLMVFNPCKMTVFSRMCLEKNIAVVMASYPATEVELCRARFCMSAGHTIEDLDYALEIISEIGDLCFLRYPKDDYLVVNSTNN
eukprot:CAMPEP_0117014100 /NCGR_PEP_ID=MMETSP0472-20121206/11507_1 /TAXON_ID=693140 ORGANISM="Tiarina fusus, Strain LIS" /NCGR_SAMPLE_ID=MMETSP0472 /ASSEMBLY_ACC=CAM_ASM_000603 /LENGTH=424 /DNA_ID=CAMNT_0004717585 /DNA_START=226 /DNA_END=1498 /DNA_ORIENTATION=-